MLHAQRFGYLKVALIAIALACSFLLVGCDSDEVKSAKASMNAEIARIEAQIDTLQNEINTAESLAATEEWPLDDAVLPALENTISHAKTIEFTAPAIPSNLEDINNETNKLAAIDYETEIQNLISAETAVTDSIEQRKLVTNPSEAFVIERLQGIDGIGELSAVTEENDPNGHLGKDGGYTATVYFASPLVDQSKVYGSSIIERGTDGGGSIEVYANVDDANKRRDYLATFDGGILASGSHTVIGTVLVRTSNNLTASQQKELEGAIIEALTQLA